MKSKLLAETSSLVASIGMCVIWSSCDARKEFSTDTGGDDVVYDLPDPGIEPDNDAMATDADYDSSDLAEPECNYVPFGQNGESRWCFYSKCTSPPPEDRYIWCAASPLDEQQGCCDPQYDNPYIANHGFWAMTGPPCEDDPATRYPTCPFYEEDGVTFYGQGVD